MSEYTDKVLSLYSSYAVDFNDYRRTLDYDEVRRVDNKYMVSTQLLSSRLGVDIELDNSILSDAVIVKLSGTDREMIAYDGDVDYRAYEKLVSLDLFAESFGYEINYKSNAIDVVRPYLTKRLVVKTSHDIDYMGALEVIDGYDNQVVLQYATEEEARLAHMAYKDNPDIEYIDIDFIVEKMGETQSVSTTGSTYSY